MTARRWREPLAIAAALAGLVAILYWPALDFRLLSFDDRYYTIENPLVAGGLDPANIARVFTTVPENNLFIPVSQLSLMADVALFGMTPRGFHLTNVLLHALNAALLSLLLWRLTGEAWKGAFAAGLVAFHPLRVESVAWVTERKGLLVVLFLILSVSCYLRYVRTGRKRWYAALLASFVLGLLSKPVLITLPFLLLLLDYWPLARLAGGSQADARPECSRFLSLAAGKIPLLAASAAVSALTYSLQGDLSLHEGVPFASRVEHSAAAFLVYLRQTAWPSGLSIRFFDAPWAEYAGTLVPAVLAVAALTGAAVRFRATKPYLLFGWLWYLVFLFPNSGIVPSGAQWIADRFTYAPHIGLAVAAVWLAADASRRFPALHRILLPSAGVAALLLLAVLTRHQMQFWRDGEALFGRGLAYNEGDPRFANQYVNELIYLGKMDEARSEIGRVLPYAAASGAGEAIRLTHLNLLAQAGDAKGVIAHAREYLARNPGSWKSRVFLADALLAERAYSEALNEYRQVVGVGRTRPEEAAHVLEGIGIALSETGRGDEAISAYNEGLRRDPSSASLNFNLALQQADRGEREAALGHFREAMRLAPGNAMIRSRYEAYLGGRP
jgi:tetratricopeptide (TPR) repeat protein